MRSIIYWPNATQSLRGLVVHHNFRGSHVAKMRWDPIWRQSTIAHTYTAFQNAVKCTRQFLIAILSCCVSFCLGNSLYATRNIVFYGFAHTHDLCTTHALRYPPATCPNLPALRPPWPTAAQTSNRDPIASLNMCDGQKRWVLLAWNRRLRLMDDFAS